jgi:hypothetical protein
MTTIRRLIVEIGIDGDLQVKKRLEEIQQSSNNLKDTLEVLEKSFITFGAGMRGTTLLSGVRPLTPAFQTTQERRETAECQRIIREQRKAEKERADTQLNIINQMFSENRQDRAFLKEFLKDVTSFIDPSLLAVIRQAKSTGQVGRPVPAKVRQFKEEKTQLAEQIQTKREFLESGIAIQAADDQLRKDEIKKNQDLVEEIKKEAQAVRIRSRTEVTTEATALIKELETPSRVKRITKESELFEFDPTQETKRISKTAIERTQKRRKREFDIESVIDIDKISNLEKRTLDLKFALRDDLTPSEKRRAIQKEVNRIIKENKRIEEEPITTPFARKVAVVRQLREEQERIGISEEVERLRRRVEPTIERLGRAERRGFVFTPARRAAELVERGRAGLMDIGEKARERAVGFLTSRFKTFQTAEEAAQKTAEENAALRQAAEEFAETKEGRRIVNQTFNFNNPIIDNEERKEDIINSFVLALKGL